MSERILIVDDSESIRSTLGGILHDEGYLVNTAATAEEARDFLGRESHDLVCLDLWLPRRGEESAVGEPQPGEEGEPAGLELLAEMENHHVDLPVIVISGQGNVDAAVKATRLGAYDFLEKPLALSRVLVTVKNALERVRMSRRLEVLASQFQKSEQMVGNSPLIRKLDADLVRAAASESRILIVGENGTGKELVARRAHRLSRRSAGPFVEVNCAAIPEELIESELFGHMKGSFTGASADRAGRFEQADGGTLFLDEIADMSLKTQAKVLRVLQEQRFERVGGTSSIQVDVRVFAATNKDLRDEIEKRCFREDLYFRLAVIPLEVPPLRERHGDVPLLVEHFIVRYANEMGRPPKQVAPAAMARLREYSWPGNVREFRNLIERWMIMVPSDEIGIHDLPPQMRSEATDRIRLLLDDDESSLRDARAAFEKRFIEHKLAQCGGNVSRTAELLGMERSNLYRKMRSYGIEVDRGLVKGD